MKDGIPIEDAADHLTTFVVGPPDAPVSVRFSLTTVEGSVNVLALDPLPPLNQNGLRRLSRHLEAIANLLEYGTPKRVTKIVREPYSPGPRS